MLVVKNKLYELNTTESKNFKDVTFLYFLWFGISRCCLHLRMKFIGSQILEWWSKQYCFTLLLWCVFLNVYFCLVFIICLLCSVTQIDTLVNNIR